MIVSLSLFTRETIGNIINGFVQIVFLGKKRKGNTRTIPFSKLTYESGEKEAETCQICLLWDESIPLDFCCKCAKAYHLKCVQRTPLEIEHWTCLKCSSSSNPLPPKEKECFFNWLRLRARLTRKEQQETLIR